VAHLFVNFSATNQRASSALDQLFHPVCVEVIDHFALSLGTFGLFTVHLEESELNHLNELLDTRLMHENVVRCDADLARVDSFSKGDLGRSEMHLSIMIDNEWALSTQFEDAWSQVLSRSLRDQFSNLGRPCEADQI